jgi:hypothetical protein
VVAFIVPQAGAVTPVAQVNAQVTVVLELPVTLEENCWVVFVITLAVVGVIARTTPVELLLLPQPTSPSAIATVSNEPSFQRFMPVLQTLPFI